MAEAYAICDRCGEKRLASALSREWTGLMVCYSCFEQRHSQDMVRARTDRQRVPFGRPALEPVFVSAFDFGFDSGFDSP